jgi:hypothetical protein
VASALALLVTIALAGCATNVAVLQVSPSTPAPAATVVPSSHALSVLGVDFDPPLDAHLVASAGVTLVVAINNEGLSDETDVRVSARLLDPAASDSAGDLFNQTVAVGALRAGEVRLVRFPTVSAIPPRLNRYRLAVEVLPAKGETDLQDNYRAFDIVLSNN